MIIGIPKEIKNLEYRVALTPAGADSLIKSGHTVLLQAGAGVKSGFLDEDYERVGVDIKTEAEDIWEPADLIVKVKEPLEEEFRFFKKDLMIFTFFHLAGNEKLTQALLEAKTMALAYENIRLENGILPILTPMSEIAGRLAIQQGARYLESPYGGSGKLLEGAPGVPPAHVVVVGAGVVGKSAVARALGSGARVTALDISTDQLRSLQESFPNQLETLYSNEYNLMKILKETDLLVAAVLIPGARAPKLISEEMIKAMPAGSVVVDVAIDQGGCVETIKEATTHEEPVFIKHGVVHSATANIPSSVCQTATAALSTVTIGYIARLANQGWKEFAENSPAFKGAISTYRGHITCQQLAGSLDLEFTNIDDLI